MKAIKTAVIFLIIIGVAGIGLNTIFGYGTITFLSNTRIPETEIWIWNFDGFNYIKNIETSINEITELALPMPTRVWQELDIVNWPSQLGNNLALMVDYWIMLINISLYPLRIGGYVVKQVLAIIGIDVINQTNTPITWLTDLVKGMVKLALPYI